MKTFLRTAAAIVAVALAFTLAACGDGHADAAKASLKASMIKESKTSDGLKLTDKQSGCVADGMVDKLGVKKLQDLKVIDDKFNAIAKGTDDIKTTKADATTIVDVLFGCTDNGTLLIDTLKKSFSTTMTGAPAATIKCVSDKVTPELVRNFMVTGYSGGDVQTLLGTAFGPCETSTK